MSASSPVQIALEQWPGDVAGEIEAKLIEALRDNDPPSDVAALAVVARDGDGALIGGLAGTTSYGWLLIKALWVAEAQRGHGLGTRLVAAAEREAVARGCHGAWLDTSSTRAHRFYARLGYRPFGTLSNGPGRQPEGHARHFLCRTLPGRDPPACD